MCQVLAGVAVVGLHAWMLSLLPDTGVDKHIPGLALLALAISVAIGLAGSWGPVPDTTFHIVVAAPEHVPIVSAEPAVVPDSVRQYAPSLIVPSELVTQRSAATLEQPASTTADPAAVPEADMHLPGAGETTLAAVRDQCSPVWDVEFWQALIVGLLPFTAFAFAKYRHVPYCALTSSPSVPARHCCCALPLAAQAYSSAVVLWNTVRHLPCARIVPSWTVVHACGVPPVQV
jgi:hypothetical protein